MFSAGVAQQIVRQQEKLHRAQLHLEKGDFVCQLSTLIGLPGRFFLGGGGDNGSLMSNDTV
jgi:hypothetical protein